MVLRLTPSSPRGPGSFAPVTPKARVARFRSLAPASGRQDHTAWPSAKRSFVHIQKRMLRSLAATAPRLHVRDDRETPLCARRDARRMRLILADRKAEYFSHEIWTVVIGLKARLKLVFRRKGFCGRKRSWRRQEGR